MPSRHRLTPRTLREWGAVLPQWLGIVGLLACLIFYFVTQQANAAILTAFAGLIVVGQGAEAVQRLGSPPSLPEATRATLPTMDPEARNGPPEGRSP